MAQSFNLILTYLNLINRQHLAKLTLLSQILILPFVLLLIIPNLRHLRAVLKIFLYIVLGSFISILLRSSMMIVMTYGLIVPSSLIIIRSFIFLLVLCTIKRFRDRVESSSLWRLFKRWLLLSDTELLWRIVLVLLKIKRVRLETFLKINQGKTIIRKIKWYLLCSNCW